MKENETRDYAVVEGYFGEEVKLCNSYTWPSEHPEKKELILGMCCYNINNETDFFAAFTPQQARRFAHALLFAADEIENKVDFKSRLEEFDRSWNDLRD